MPTDLEQEGDFWVSTVKIRKDGIVERREPRNRARLGWTADVALKLNLQGMVRLRSQLPRTTLRPWTITPPSCTTKPTGLAIHQYGVLGKPG
jgi:hypothetical protein